MPVRRAAVVAIRFCSAKAGEHSVSYKLPDVLQKIEERSAERIKLLFDGVRAEIRGVESGLRGEIRGVESGLRGEINGLRGEIHGLESGLRGELRGQSKVYAMYGMIIGTGIGFVTKLLYERLIEKE